MHRRLLARTEQPGRFDDHIDTQIGPWQLRRVAFREHLEAVAVDDEKIAVHSYVARKTPVNRVEPEEVGERCCVRQVIDGHDIEFRVAAFEDGAKNETADAAKAIDPDFDSHAGESVSFREVATTIRSGG